MKSQQKGATLPLPQLVTEFLSYLGGARNYSPLTLKAYAHDLRQLEHWLGDNGLPDSPTELHGEHFYRYAEHLASRYAPSTLGRKLNCASSFFRYLLALGKVDVNPLAAVPRPKRTPTTADIPTVDECRLLLDACHTPRERTILLLLMTTGIRRAELIGLDCEHLTPDLTTITVTGKGRKQRVVPVPAITREALQSYLADRPERSGPLIVNEVHRRLGATSLRRLFCRVVERAGFAGRSWTPHVMRHLFATRMLRGGCGLPELQELLGHSSAEATLRYLHADPTVKQRSVARWAGELAGDPTATTRNAATDEEGE